MAPIVFYDLTLDTPNEIWSPNTVRTRVCLNIKKLAFETVWLDFFGVHSTIPELTKTGKAPTVPVIIDKEHDDKVVQDSWDIALYLDKAFPDAPKLIREHEPLFLFFNRFCMGNLLLPVFSMSVLKIHGKVATEDMQNWFREDREKNYKRKLEDFNKDEAGLISTIKESLKYVDMVLKKNPYIAGNQPSFADATLAAPFVMLHTLRPDMFESVMLDAVPKSDAIRKWWTRMLPLTNLDTAPESHL
ncbi:hypothetical protein BC940DRAFT_289314 [Gongronella butleri]|nr:hypothetical protein BC940DRAFT_289314 [Gongronella butleri]